MVIYRTWSRCWASAGALSASRVRDAAEVGAPLVRAEEPLDDEPADPADGSRDRVGLGQKRAPPRPARLRTTRSALRQSSVGLTA
jgi:hypothetical protein